MHVSNDSELVIYNDSELVIYNDSELLIYNDMPSSVITCTYMIMVVLSYMDRE